MSTAHETLTPATCEAVCVDCGAPCEGAPGDYWCPLCGPTGARPITPPTYWRIRRLCEREAVQRGNATLWEEAAQAARARGELALAGHYDRLSWSARGRARRLRGLALKAR